MATNKKEKKKNRIKRQHFCAYRHDDKSVMTNIKGLKAEINSDYCKPKRKRQDN